MAGNSPQTRLMMPMEAGLNPHIWDNMVVVGAPAADTCTKARKEDAGRRSHCRLPNAWVCVADALVVLNYARILEDSPREHRLWSWWELSSSRMEQKCDQQHGMLPPTNVS